jgi:hypothetical protein
MNSSTLIFLRAARALFISTGNRRKLYSEARNVSCDPYLRIKSDIERIAPLLHAACARSRYAIY